MTGGDGVGGVGPCNGFNCTFSGGGGSLSFVGFCSDGVDSGGVKAGCDS